MKKILLFLGCLGFFYITTLTAASNLKNVKVNNKSINVGTINAAIGRGSTANTGSINIKNSNISNMKIHKSSINVRTINAAIGPGATANSGSINVD